MLNYAIQQRAIVGLKHLGPNITLPTINIMLFGIIAFDVDPFNPLYGILRHN